MMVNLSGDIQNAVAVWAADSYLRVVKDIKLNLTGRVLNRQTGNLVNNIDVCSGVTPNGFFVGTNLVYGISWEKGRRSFTIFPAEGRPYARLWQKNFGPSRDRLSRSQAYQGILPHDDPRARLRFIKGGMEIFARQVTMPAQPPRPFISPAVESNKEAMKNDLIGKIKSVLMSSFTDLSITVEYQI